MTTINVSEGCAAAGPPQPVTPGVFRLRAFFDEAFNFDDAAVSLVAGAVLGLVTLAPRVAGAVVLEPAVAGPVVLQPR